MRTEREVEGNDLEGLVRAISHDVRAPMRAIDGLAQLLLLDFQAELPAEALQLLHAIAGNTRRMNALIEGLLRLTRLMQQPLVKQRVDVTALVQDLVKGEPARPIQIAVAALPEVEADPELLRLVFVSLLSNAFKFTAKTAGAYIEITGERGDGACVYAVRDNGAGFDLQHAQHLFGLFQRFHPIEQFDGLGTGLAMARCAIQRHGGRIWAETQVDQGATFSFCLPG